MKRLSSVFLLLVIGVLVSAAPARPRPEIMGISLDMKRAEALARLKSIGSLEREVRKRQEVWAVKDALISHLLVGYDADHRWRGLLGGHLLRRNGSALDGIPEDTGAPANN